MATAFKRAEQFVWENARLLDRRRFAFHFGDGTREEVLRALRGYQNLDGGFGNALEPDLRDAHSQTVPTQHALEILDEVGFEVDLGMAICDWLERVTTEEGGVPFVLPSARAYPHAPWWQPEDAPAASINPTAAIAGLLLKNGVQHSWLGPAVEYCWRQIATVSVDDMHALGCAITFLRHAPDQERAQRALGDLGRAMLASGVIAAPEAEGYVRKPSDWAPTPDHPLRQLIPADWISRDLRRLEADQQRDGGWPIAWSPPSEAALSEWRGWVTVAALLTLRANGILEQGDS
jgi:hypothetical protein